MILESNRYQVEPDITVYELSGRLSLGSASQALEWKLGALPGEGVRKLVVDLSKLQSIDSAGVGILVMVAGKFADAGGAVRIAGAQGAVANVFSIVHMDKIATLSPSVTDACQSLA